MYCRYCGKELENSARICKYCGIPTYGPYKPLPPKPFPELQNDINTDIGMGSDTPATEPVSNPEPQKTYLVTGVVPPPANNGTQSENPNVYAPKPAPVKRIYNGFSIAGFVLSLLSVIFIFAAITDSESIFVSLPITVLGLTFSIIGTVKSKKLGTGKGLGIAGIVLSSISTSIWLFMILTLFFVYLAIIISGGVIMP